MLVMQDLLLLFPVRLLASLLFYTVFTWLNGAPRIVATLRGPHNQLWEQWLTNRFRISNDGQV